MTRFGVPRVNSGFWKTGGVVPYFEREYAVNEDVAQVLKYAVIVAPKDQTGKLEGGSEYTGTVYLAYRLDCVLGDTENVRRAIYMFESAETDEPLPSASSMRPFVLCQECPVCGKDAEHNMKWMVKYNYPADGWTWTDASYLQVTCIRCGYKWCMQPKGERNGNQ